MIVPNPAESSGSAKNMIQIGEACSLRFSAIIQRFSIVYTSLLRIICQAAANSAAANTQVKASSPQL